MNDKITGMNAVETRFIASNKRQPTIKSWFYHGPKNTKQDKPELFKAKKQSEMSLRELFKPKNNQK